MEGVKRGGYMCRYGPLVPLEIKQIRLSFLGVNVRIWVHHLLLYG